MERDPFYHNEHQNELHPYKPIQEQTFFERFSYKSLTFKTTVVQFIIFFLTIFHTVYLTEKYLDEDEDESDIYSFECVLYTWGSKHTPSIVYRFQFWRLVCPIFLHGSFSHIIGNMAVQLYYGFILELTHGWRRVSILYIVGGIGASLFSCVRFYYETSVGASGSIFALLALELIYFITAFPGIEPKRIVVFILLAPMIFLSFIDAPPQVDIAGHLGGLVVGLLIGIGYAFADAQSNLKKQFQYIFYGLVGLLFIYIFIILYQNKLEDEQICKGMNII
ncbi:unnamed protein product [Paramecium sonneborni]|uniref:Rhomboid-like protease n=1 Tax=Paramecium sonneborni TaxID=65129 RepID=A0A8S1MMN2_9CILI|nr:unnamed protein product [Paramecium sonneborni]